MIRHGIQAWLVLGLIIVVMTSTVAGAKQTLTILHGSRLPYIAWLEAVVERFELDHPDIEVKIDMSTAGPAKQVPVLVAAGTPPDISLSDPHVVLDFARKGILVDLLPYLNRDAAFFADWVPPALKIAESGGHLYALPQDLQVYAVYYNVDALRSSGLAVPTESWSYNDFREKARKLSLQDGQGVALRHGSALPDWRSWAIPVWAHGGDFVDSWSTPTRFVGWSEETRNGLQYLKDLVDTRAIPDNTSSPLKAFVAQKITMYMQNSIRIQDFQSIDAFTWDVVPVPVGPVGRETAIAGLSWFILEGAKDKEKAWVLLRHITSPESLQMLVEMVGVVPPNRKVTQKWIMEPGTPRHRQFFLTGIETARPNIGALPASVWAPIEKYGRNAIFSKEPIASALEHMEKQVKAAIAELQ